MTNNVVVTSACWGIFFSSVHGGKIVNNTVVADGSDTGTKTRELHVPPVVVGDKTHQGSPSSDVIIRNNIANGLNIYNLDPNMTMDHNICLAINGKCQIVTYVDGKPRLGHRASQASTATTTSSTDAAPRACLSILIPPSSSTTSG